MCSWWFQPRLKWCRRKNAPAGARSVEDGRYGGRFTPTGKARGYSQKGCDKATRGFFLSLPHLMAKKRARQIARTLCGPGKAVFHFPSPSHNRGDGAPSGASYDVVRYRFRHVALLGAPSRRSHIRRRAALSTPGHPGPFGSFGARPSTGRQALAGLTGRRQRAPRRGHDAS
jgi:hypothetical protein